MEGRRQTQQVPKISQAEWKVMKVVWNRNPISANEVVETMAGSSDWKPRTIRTLINRLVDKGALEYEKRSRAFYYTPTFQENDYLTAESESFLGRFFNGSINPMVAHFLQSDKISPEEYEDLRRIFSKKGRRRGK